jgi:AraC-like DNA-binding protein
MAGTAGALSPIAVNPAGSGDFGRRHVILNGRTSKPMQMATFTGPFSIKSVVTGRATWETAAGRYPLTPGRHLILDRGTSYSLTIDGDGPVETFCVFFRDGFVEEALRSLTKPEARLLDDPVERAESFALLEATHDSGDAPGPQLATLHRIVQEEGVGSLRLSGVLHDAALRVVDRSSALMRMSRRLPSARPATRRELVRRLHHARDFMRSSLGDALCLDGIARAACLSPFHFHRSFRAFFGETPHQFVIRLRLELAADRLRRTSSSVTDVALAAGFESPAHFSRAFKIRFGCSPKAYRHQFGRYHRLGPLIKSSTDYTDSTD